MLNWNEIEKARLHREDLLREASAESRSQEIYRPMRSMSLLLAIVVALHHRLMAA